MPKVREMGSDKIILFENQVFLNSFLSAGIKLCICNSRKYQFIYVRIINIRHFWCSWTLVFRSE